MGIVKDAIVGCFATASCFVAFMSTTLRLNQTVQAAVELQGSPSAPGKHYVGTKFEAPFCSKEIVPWQNIEFDVYMIFSRNRWTTL